MSDDKNDTYNEDMYDFNSEPKKDDDNLIIDLHKHIKKLQMDSMNT